MYWYNLMLCGYGAAGEFQIFYGGAEGTRTPDLLRAREALSHLSYSPFTVLPVFTVNPQGKWWAIEGSNL